MHTCVSFRWRSSHATLSPTAAGTICGFFQGLHDQATIVESIGAMWHFESRIVLQLEICITWSAGCCSAGLGHMSPVRLCLMTALHCRWRSSG